MLRQTLLLLGVFFITQNPFAQNILVRQAAQATQDLDYVTAIILYQQTLQIQQDPEAVIGLAECYRQINDTENAERWYAEAIKLPNAKPRYGLYYGMMLQANNKCTDAQKWFDQYAANAPDDARGQYLRQSCEAAAALRAAGEGIYTVKLLPFNSNLDDFAPTIRGQQLIFASDRNTGGPVNRTNMWTGSEFTELYALNFHANGPHPADFSYEVPEKFSKGLNSKYHEAATTFSPDGRTIYFTRNSYLNGHTERSETGLLKLKIYAGNTNAADTWGNLQALPFCSDDYNTAHPALSPDGKHLFFSSNRPGGYGGMDLYVSEWEGGRWGLPVNLGPIVNTEGNEVFPYADKSGRVYFSSNSHIGLGGLDIYYTTPNGAHDWNAPINLGAPMNSTHDDFGIAFGGDGTWGFFSSDRDEGVGRDDVYGFQKTAIPLDIIVFDTTNRKPAPGVLVTNTRTGQSMLTGPDGRVSFDLRPDECTVFTTEKKKYDANKSEFCTQKTVLGETSRLDIPIERTADYALQGMVFDMIDGYPAEGARVMLTNDCGESIPEVVLTGIDGRFLFKLGKNCCYTIKAYANGYISDVSDAQCTAGLPPETVLRTTLSLQPYRDAEGFVLKKDVVAGDFALPVFNPATGLYENANGAPASIDMGNGIVVRNGVLFDNGVANKPAETDWKPSATGKGFLVNLYYDFNQAALQPESVPELQKLQKTLLENPDLTVEIASHTDSRGSDEYNLDLSQRRADAAVSWLQQHGIAPNRLSAHGYGETQPVNGCSNEVPCSEEEHQRNRRTEFRITGSTTILSQPKNTPKAAPCKGCPF